MVETGIVSGFEQAMSVIGSGRARPGKAEKFSDMFSNQGAQIRSFGDFLAWKINIATEERRKLLEELKRLAARMRASLREGTYDGQRLGLEASESLKSFAASHGVDLGAATLPQIESLIGQLEKEIISIGKCHAFGLIAKKGQQSPANMHELLNFAVDQSQLFRTVGELTTGQALTK